MSSKLLTVHCAKCNHEWKIPLKMPMLLRDFTRVLRGYTTAGCPECGAFNESVLLGPAEERRVEPPVPVNSDV